MRSKRMLMGAAVIGCLAAAMTSGAYAQEANTNQQLNARTGHQPAASHTAATNDVTTSPCSWLCLPRRELRVASCGYPARRERGARIRRRGGRPQDACRSGVAGGGPGWPPEPADGARRRGADERPGPASARNGKWGRIAVSSVTVCAAWPRRPSTGCAPPAQTATVAAGCDPAAGSCKRRACGLCEVAVRRGHAAGAV